VVSFDFYDTPPEWSRFTPPQNFEDVSPHRQEFLEDSTAQGWATLLIVTMLSTLRNRSSNTSAEVSRQNIRHRNNIFYSETILPAVGR